MIRERDQSPNHRGMMKSRSRCVEGSSGFWKSGSGLLLLALALLIFVLTLWFFIERQEGSLFPAPRIDQSDLREAPR